ncbi:MAG TPA: MG2 domain-containing protein, partial [Planctomycetaceae bacterium]|nr:MG2 domain-containing protein [Planctomycetaceae bacterium]
MAAVNRVRWLVAGCLVAGGLWVLRLGMTAEPAEPAGRTGSGKPTVGRADARALGGPDRWLTYLSTDKPVYRAGEQVYVRGVLLNAHTRKPLDEQQGLSAQVQIKGPKGDVVASGGANSENSVLAFSWKVPAEQAGGQYKVVVTHPWEGHPPAERAFEIRSYRAPRLRSQIEFVRDGYGPGDAVSASLKVSRAEGGVPAGAKVTVLARIDGVEVFREETAVSPDGTCGTKFPLPAEIARGEGTLAFVVEDGGVVETASKTIPILLQTVDLAMFAEGGDLVASVPTRLYVEAKTPAQKPADIAGEIVDGAGRMVATFRTEHEGRGRVTFSPAAGASYTLRITEPAGIKTTFPLPEVKADGVVIRALDDVVAAGDAVRLELVSSTSRRVQVTLSRREEELFAARSITLNAGKAVPVSVKPNGDGILIATVWDENGRPLAERLVYREPAERLNVTIAPDQTNYVPGGTAALKIKATNAQGEPVSAVVGVTVTDDSVLEMIEKREQPPRLPVMVLLDGDVRELADAHVYLDSDNPEAPLAVDLLLGTQGWRRFAFVDTAKFVAEHGDDARRVLALKMPSQRERLAAQRGGGALRFFAARDGAPRPAAAPLELAAPAGAAVPQDEPQDEPQAEADLARLAEPEARNEGRAQQEGQAELRQALEQAERKLAADELFEADREALGGRRRLAGPAQNDFILVREYAHQVRPDRQPGDRADFTETLFWSAGVRTDARTGEGSVSFALNDSVTSFRVFADAFDSAGALGQGTTTIESVEPFYVEPKLPLEITSTDRIRVPLNVVNSTGGPLAGAQLQIEAKGLEVTGLDPVDLPAGGRVRQLVSIDAGGFVGEANVTLTARAGPYADRVTRKLRVKAAGFPVAITHGGMLNADSRVKHELTVPDQIIPGSLTATVNVFPTPLANLTEALEALIREPSGCF